MISTQARDKRKIPNQLYPIRWHGFPSVVLGGKNICTFANLLPKV